MARNFHTVFTRVKMELKKQTFDQKSRMVILYSREGNL